MSPRFQIFLILILSFLIFTTKIGSSYAAGEVDPRWQMDSNRICPQYGEALGKMIDQVGSEVDRLKIGMLQTTDIKESQALAAMLLEKSAFLVSLQDLKDGFDKAWAAKKQNPYFTKENYKYLDPKAPPVYTSPGVADIRKKNLNIERSALEKVLEALPKNLKKESMGSFKQFQKGIKKFLDKLFAKNQTNGVRTIHGKVKKDQKEIAETGAGTLQDFVVDGASQTLQNEVKAYSADIVIEEIFIGAEASLMKNGISFLAGSFTPPMLALQLLAPLFMGATYSEEDTFNMKVDEKKESSSKSPVYGNFRYPEFILSLPLNSRLYCISFEGNPRLPDYEYRQKTFQKMKNQLASEEENSFRVRLNEVKKKIDAAKPCVMTKMTAKELNEAFKTMQAMKNKYVEPFPYSYSWADPVPPEKKFFLNMPKPDLSGAP